MVTLRIEVILKRAVISIMSALGSVLMSVRRLGSAEIPARVIAIGPSVVLASIVASYLAYAFFERQELENSLRLIREKSRAAQELLTIQINMNASQEAAYSVAVADHSLRLKIAEIEGASTSEKIKIAKKLAENELAEVRAKNMSDIVSASAAANKRASEAEAERKRLIPDYVRQ